MNWAWDLWVLSITLAVVALAIIAMLLIARIVAGWFAGPKEAARKYWLRALLGESGPAERISWSPGSKSQLVELSTELIQLVRGSDREAFVARAEQLGVPRLLRKRLGKGSPRVRVAAAEALAQFPGDESLDELTDALSDPTPDVRLSAALSLAQLGHAPPVRELIAKLGIGTREKSRLVVALFREIGRSRRNEIEELLVLPDVPAGAKAAAIESLAASGDYRMVPTVNQIVLDAPQDSPELPRYLRALADFAHPAAEPAIRKSFASPNWEARAAAARAAGRIGLRDLGSELKDLLSDPEWWVRFRAAEALAALGEPGVALLRQATTEEEPARTAAARTIAEKGLA